MKEDRKGGRVRMENKEEGEEEKVGLEKNEKGGKGK